MKAKLRAGEWFGIFFVLVIVYVLVRPRSNAAQFVAALGAFVKALVGTATDTAK